MESVLAARAVGPGGAGVRRRADTPVAARKNAHPLSKSGVRRHLSARGANIERMTLPIALFTILGGLIAAAVAFWSQQRSGTRAERLTQAERSRVERIQAYTAFSTAAMDVRRAQFDRWHQRDQGGRDSPQHVGAKAESYRRRSTAWESLYRVELVANDANIENLAQTALEGISKMHKAEDRADVDDRGERARLDVEGFVRGADRQLKEERRSGPGWLAKKRR